MLGKLASKGQPGVQYGKVDLQRNPQMGMDYGVRSIPDTRIFHNGQEIGKFVGSRDAASIQKMVDQYMASVRPEGEMNPEGGPSNSASPARAVQPAIRPEPANRSLPPGITPIPAS